MPTLAPSITLWTRLEVSTRTSDMRAGLEARTADPLWLLARQWQLGEFQGEDAGSPVIARVRARAERITHYRKGTTAPAEPLPAQVPLEALVEREPRETAGDRRLGAEAGQQFLRFLERHGARTARAHFLQAYPLSAEPGPAADDATRGYLRLMAGRVPDGLALYRAVRAGKVKRPAGALPGLEPALKEWGSWLEPLLRTEEKGMPAWDRERMEYRFAVASKAGGKETVLVATEYDGHRLDWSDLEVLPGGSLGAREQVERVVRTVLPSPASYAGMPSSRYWEFEDARVHFGGMTAENTDLARMVLIEYATMYSNDFFLIPLDLPVGSISRVDSLLVVDTFGVRTLVPAAPSGEGWSLFRPTVQGTQGTEPVLVLLPTVAETLDSAPVEELLLLRDEMANMAWAVERTVPGVTGRPVDRHELYQRARALEPRPAPSGEKRGVLTYTLQSSVPDHWVPLELRLSAQGRRVLRRLWQRSPSGEPLEAFGRLLDPASSSLELPEEEVPREGVRVTRAWQIARGADGSIHLWLGRSKLTGRGEGSSGLRFDAVEPQEQRSAAS
jgi:hypothetical protein